LSEKHRKLKILIRTSGGSAKKKELGFGHIFRSINLSKMISDNEIFFLIEDHGGVKSVLQKNKIRNSIFLPKNLNLNKDIMITKKILNEKKIDILIVDKYNINIKFFKGISNEVKIVYISDLKKIQFPVDLVINGFIGFKNKVSRNKYNAKCLIGPKYQIINEKFVLNKLEKRPINLLVTFGGFDENGLIELVIKRWLNMKEKFKMKIILGPGTKESKFIQNNKKKYSKLLIIQKETTKMYSEMSKTKFGLCSGGITSYEFAIMNIPFGIICMTDHQRLTANEWQKKNVAKNLGVYNLRLAKKVDNFLKLILTDKLSLKKSRQIINQHGIKTIQKEIIKLVN